MQKLARGAVATTPKRYPGAQREFQEAQRLLERAPGEWNWRKASQDMHFHPEDRELLRTLEQRSVSAGCLPYGKNQLYHMLNRINWQFWKRYGCYGIVRVSLHNHRISRTGLRTLALNPKLFGTPPKPQPGRDFKMEELWSERECRIFLYIAAHRWCTVNEIGQATGLTKADIHRAMARANEKTNKLGMGNAIDRVLGSPSLYHGNRTLAQALEVEYGDTAIREVVFRRREWNLIQWVHKHPGRFRSEILPELNWTEYVYENVRKQIKRKCAIFGIEPFDPVLFKTGKIVLTAEMHATLGLSPVAYPRQHFPGTRWRILQFLAEHPYSNSQDIGKALGLHKDTVRQLLTQIRHILAGKKWPPITTYKGPHGEWQRYAMPKALCRLLELPYTKPPESIELVFIKNSTRRGPVYRYFKEHPEGTMAEASVALGIPPNTLISRVRYINRQLARNGETLRYGRAYHYKYPTALLAQICAYQELFGEWPTREEIVYVDPWMGGALKRHFNGRYADALRSARQSPMSPEKRRLGKMIEEYLALKEREQNAIRRMGLGRFEERSEQVRRVAIRAIIEQGAVLKDVRGVLRKSRDASDALHRIHNLYGPIPKTTVVVNS